MAKIIRTEDELKEALLKLLANVADDTMSPPMVAAAMGEALAAFLQVRYG